MTAVHTSIPAPRFVSARTLTEPGAVPFTLEVCAGQQGLDRPISHPRVQKSGLALAGHFEGIAPERVQLLGHTEMTYAAALDPERRLGAFEAFLSRGLACVVVTAGHGPGVDLSRAADRHGCPVLRSPAKSSVTIHALHALLDDRLAPRARVHGVFVDVYGVGILLLGRSGIGKSECALELVERGHRLVADDVVDCVLRAPDNVSGAATELLRNHLEVRGLGVLNIRDMFGVAAVRDRKRIALVIRLVARDEDEAWDRLGIDEEWFEILGARVPLKCVPVRPGKNTACTVEVAARNELLRQAGHHSARAFHARLAAALGVQDPSIPAPGHLPGKAGP
ncbi:MAG: HPr(Ser) kinase/phosphatase [Deltaproteobacteria bacterium]|nr:HPr(Ser) kinase/phosphatase [Deltaproteobacteria bacterium]